MAVLRAEERIAGVILRNETYDQWLEPGAWRQASESSVGSFDYRLYCAVPENGNVFGAYTNGASIYDRSRLLALGYGIHGEPGNAVGFPAVYSEANYALRVALRYPCSAVLRTRNDCELVACSGVFSHTGSGQSIMGGVSQRELRRGRRVDWLVYDTPLADVAPAQHTEAQ